MKTNQPKYVALALVIALQVVVLLATCNKESPGEIEYTPTLPNKKPMQGTQYSTEVGGFHYPEFRRSGSRNGSCR